LIEVLIGISTPRRTALEKENMRVPNAVIAKLLIDTGASCTCINPAILEPLGIAPTGAINIQTPSTNGKPVSCPQYDVAMMIYHTDNSRFLPTIAVTGADVSSQGIDGLLGRDVLAHCLFVYDGRAEFFQLAF